VPSARVVDRGTVTPDSDGDFRFAVLGLGRGEHRVLIDESHITSNSEPAESIPIARTVPKPKPKPKPEPRASSASSRSMTVPNVVGKDHQLAQDLMQAAGLYSLRERDASGAGRMLLLDRNWTVLRQSPAAGTQVSEDVTITLYSVKDEEVE
jgi:hypothetical protein